jgi:hypothetical protein
MVRAMAKANLEWNVLPRGELRQLAENLAAYL